MYKKLQRNLRLLELLGHLPDRAIQTAEMEYVILKIRYGAVCNGAKFVYCLFCAIYEHPQNPCCIGCVILGQLHSLSEA